MQIIDNKTAVIDGLYLFSQSDNHRLYSVWEFQTFWVEAVLANKARLFYLDGTPVALTTWCFLSKQEGQDFLDDRFVPSEAVYSRDDGEQLWGIEFIAPFGHAKRVMRSMKDLHTSLYGTRREVYWRRFSNRNSIHKGVFK